MLKIPVKITPDRIRDSIVQIFFQADIPFEPLIGYCYSTLSTLGWRYANRSPMQEAQKGLVIELSTGSQHFFIKDKVRLQLFPNNSLAFNCISGYIGWNEYGIKIKSVINSLIDTGHFKMFRRIGIRYISEFANIDILEKIKFQATLPSINGEIKSRTYRFIFEESNIAKNIQIASKLPVNAILQETNVTVNFVSLLDVDIVKKSLNIKDAGGLWHEIDTLHTVEKQTFFGLLTEDFLQSLNPEYA